jgi:hypothetical protein
MVKKDKKMTTKSKKLTLPGQWLFLRFEKHTLPESPKFLHVRNQPLLGHVFSFFDLVRPCKASDSSW